MYRYFPNLSQYFGILVKGYDEGEVSAVIC